MDAPILPPDLALVAVAWPEWPEVIKAEIMAIVKAAEPARDGGVG